MKNVAASVRARLLNLSRASGEPFAALLEQYVTGRFLYRLSQSRYKDRFILKGAQLFRLWSEEAHRSTRDLDLLGFGDSSEEAIKGIFSEISELSIEPNDGIEWEEVKTGPIRADMDYGGVRANLLVSLAGARVSLQIDVGFGDVVSPEPQKSEWRSLLDFPSVNLLAYPPETVIAEKLEAAVTLQLSNSRMKDFYDLYWLSQHMSFDRAVLSGAIAATFARRGTELPEEAPLALTSEFASDPGKNTQWKAFLRKGKLEAPTFPEIIPRLAGFLMPVIENKGVQQKWEPGRGWVDGE
ncbi:MAG: nucleotidyl transferase AbiEii/AbiGii toxin family protein [Verrucomicrobia bacterium]|nr:nucleotidyl transferase AbiEii/AbiGii toxin family protein [Verrucomicrobiota bacterium]